MTAYSQKIIGLFVSFLVFKVTTDYCLNYTVTWKVFLCRCSKYDTIASVTKYFTNFPLKYLVDFGASCFASKKNKTKKQNQKLFNN